MDEHGGLSDEPLTGPPRTRTRVLLVVVAGVLTAASWVSLHGPARDQPLGFVGALSAVLLVVGALMPATRLRDHRLSRGRRGVDLRDLRTAKAFLLRASGRLSGWDLRLTDSATGRGRPFSYRVAAYLPPSPLTRAVAAEVLAGRAEMDDADRLLLQETVAGRRMVATSSLFRGLRVVTGVVVAFTAVVGATTVVDLLQGRSGAAPGLSLYLLGVSALLVMGLVQLRPRPAPEGLVTGADRIA